MRIAIPKGRLYEGVCARFARAGITITQRDPRDYHLDTNDPRIDARLIKARAIPQLVSLGNFDLGCCGLDLIRESQYEEAVPIIDLGLNPVGLVVAVAAGHEDIIKNPPKRPLLIATEYEALASRWAMSRGLSHITIQTWGSTEAYAPDDADIVFDCVETGRTMEANGLVIIDRILHSTTWVIANHTSLLRATDEIRALIARLQNTTEEES